MDRRTILTNTGPRRHRVLKVAVTALLALLSMLVLGRGDANPSMRVIAVGGNPGGLAVATRTGRVFVLNHNTDSSGIALGPGSVSMLDAQSGAILRTIVVGGNPSTLAVDERSVRVFVITPSDNSVRILHARSGTILRAITLPGPLYTVAAVAVDEQASRAFVVASDGTVSVLDARSGHILHIVNVDAALDSVAVDQRAGHIFVTSPDKARVNILDARDGTILRTTTLSHDVGHVAVDDGVGRVFVTGYTGISVLDSSGKELHSIPLRAMFTAAAVDRRRKRIFVATNNAPGSVSMLNTQNGHVLRTASVGIDPAVVDMAVDERRDRVFICTGSSVRVLDARSDVPLRNIRVSGCDGGMAIDERTGHVFVINSGGPMPLPDTWRWIPRELRRWLWFLPPPGSRTRVVPGSISMLDPSRA